MPFDTQTLRSVRTRFEPVEMAVEKAAPLPLLDSHLDFARWSLEPNGRALDGTRVQ